MLACFCGLSQSVAEDRIVLWQRAYDLPQLRDYVEAAAEASKERYGPYQLIRSEALEQGRATQELLDGELLNVAVLGATAQREHELLGVYYPIDKGLLGIRVCLIQSHRQAVFNPIRNLHDWRRNDLVVGMGAHWPDVPIWRSNRMHVETSPIYAALFEMLSMGRFDCLSRSVNEIETELQHLEWSKYAIEENLAVVYPMANLVFVSPEYPELHQRLVYGMEKAKQEGLLDTLFDKHYPQTLERLRVFQRKLIVMENPHITHKARQTINEDGLIAFELAQVKPSAKAATD